MIVLALLTLATEPLASERLACVDKPCVITRVRLERGDGERIDDASVVLHKGKIVSAGKGEVTLPPGAQVIVATGRVLTPGLIEALSDLGVDEVQGVKESRDDHSPGPVTPAFRVGDGFNPATLWVPLAREEGVTGAAVMPHGHVLYGTGNWLDTTLLPQLETKPLAMFGGLGRHAVNAAGGSRGGLWMRLRELIADARFYKANRRAFDDGRTRPLSLPRLQIEALLPVLDGQQLLVLEADRASDISAAIELGRTEKLRIAIAGGGEAYRVRDALAKAKIPVILQPTAQTPNTFDQLLARDDAATLLHQANVPLVLTASNDQRIGRLRQEAGIAVANGLPYAAALKAVTLAPAELYGRGAELGSVREGKRATVVLWSGDPFELSSVAERVFVDGVEQPLDTRQKALVRRYYQRDDRQKGR